ncbi:hypothetical protein P4S72_24380 [Vibrio sp. PP-XX7]
MAVFWARLVVEHCQNKFNLSLGGLRFMKEKIYPDQNREENCASALHYPYNDFSITVPTYGLSDKSLLTFLILQGL